MPRRRVRVIREMTPEFRACCSGVLVGVIGMVLPRTSSVPEGKEFVQFSAKSLGYKGGDPIRGYIEKDFLEG